MITFQEAALANEALRKVVDLAFADTSLTKSARDALLSESAEQFLAHIGIPAAEGADVIRKVTDGKIVMKSTAQASGAPEIIRKTVPAEPVRHATRAEALVLAREAVAGQVAALRKAAPHLREDEARIRVFSEHPGLRTDLMALDDRRGPSQDIAKAEQLSSAQIEAVAKAAKLMQADPRLSKHQAFTRVYGDSPALLKRLMTERRGQV